MSYKIRFFIDDTSFIHEMKFIPCIGTEMVFEGVVTDIGGTQSFIHHVVERIVYFNECDDDLQIHLSSNSLRDL